MTWSWDLNEAPARAPNSSPRHPLPVNRLLQIQISGHLCVREHRRGASGRGGAAERRRRRVLSPSAAQQRPDRPGACYRATGHHPHAIQDGLAARPVPPLPAEFCLDGQPVIPELDGNLGPRLIEPHRVSVRPCLCGGVHMTTEFHNGGRPGARVVVCAKAEGKLPDDVTC
jgi:hypothetical protein